MFTDSASSSVMEYWFTGPSHQVLTDLAARLLQLGISVTDEPWKIEHLASKVTDPWSMAGHGPSSVDPTVVAALAFEAGCQYYPGGPQDRWNTPASIPTGQSGPPAI